MNAISGFDPVAELIELSIKEDITDPSGKIQTGDHSALCCIPSNKIGKAQLLVKDDGVLAGVSIAERICQLIDSQLQLNVLIRDGETVSKGQIAFYVTGPELKILQAERLMLNFMQRMSGIATTTKFYVEAVAGTGVKILDTRKTTPGLRAFEKLAVKIGGGHNHRFGLYDMIMLKDNHVDFCGGISHAILAAKNYKEKLGLSIPVEIETRSLDEVKEALETGHIQRIMFDNFSPDHVATAVELVNRKVETEVSGGITLNTISTYAAAKPDFISVGALTHSSRSLDLSLKAIKNQA
ncbi:MAG: carboxylating nicotinate-nucleotide diphosphorylase [Chitinophagales bacterium]